MVDGTSAEHPVTARYSESDTERLIRFEHESRTAVIAQPKRGYAMISVRDSVNGDELERYYGFDMALDHAAELLGVSQASLPIPEEAADFGI